MMKVLKYALITIIILGVLTAGYFVLSVILITAPSEANSNANTSGSTTANTANKPVNQNLNLNKPVNINKPVAPVMNLSKVFLTVPYINESPDGSWTGPWKNACEEASMTMVDKYYYGLSSVTVKDAMKMMNTLFAFQNNIWGSNADSDTARTLRIIEENTIYNATIIEKPTILQIQKELQGKRPVIVPLYGFDLGNKNIPFVPAPRGTSYHMIVIIGYDDVTKEFITNDTGDTKAGPSHRYSYDVLMNAIHDYSFVTRHADGPARAIFTYPKLVKLIDSPRVYFLHDQVKQYIPSEEVFKANNWTWSAVNIVEAEWLDTFTMGEDVK
jgi:hypothetical protein